MSSATGSIALPPPPPDRTRISRALMLVLSGGGAIGAAALGNASLGGISLLSALAFALLYRARKQEVAVGITLASLDRAARGRFDEARALHEAIAPWLRRGTVGMAIEAQRAALAVYEGRLDEAVVHATRGAREGKWLQLHARLQRASALSIRAVALAGLGKREQALADVKTVRAAEYPQASFLARAALTEAILFAREKDFDSLAKVLRDDRALLFGATSPRERIVARALARMLATKKVSVYREPAKRDSDLPEEHKSWVAQFAPEAAPYAQTQVLGQPLSSPEPIERSVIARAEQRGPKPASSWKRLVLGSTLIALAIWGIWKLLSETRLEDATTLEAVDGAAALPEASLWALPGAVALVVLLAVTGIFLFRMSGRKFARRLNHVMELRARGRYEEAESAAKALASSKAFLVAPQAQRELATLASLRGDFRAAQEHARVGIGALGQSRLALALARPVLLPMLHGELALAFAGDHRANRAEDELRQLEALYPSYPYLARDSFRTRLVGLVAKGRLLEAATAARERPVDLPLSFQEELLCDAARVFAGDHLPEGERERIELDLRDDLVSAQFVERLSPTLLAKLRGVSPVRVAEPAQPSTDEDAEEEEEDEPASASTKKLATPS